MRAARERGIAACAGHELTGAYGLETRTLTAAINASILPIVERTAAMVEEALAEAQLDVPLLVLRGDGGSMSSERFRDQPSLTIGSAPAAGVAAVLHELRLTDAIVIECGGTSTNVSVVRSGRAQLRSLPRDAPAHLHPRGRQLGGRCGGGSMALLGRRGIAEVGPRSAHIAGLPYASFATVGGAARRGARARRSAGRRPGGLRLHRRGRRPVRPDGDVRLDRPRTHACRLVPGELRRGRTRRLRAAGQEARWNAGRRRPRAARHGHAEGRRGDLGGREAVQASGWTSRSSRSAVQARRSSPKWHAGSIARPCSRATPRSSRRSAPPSRWSGRRSCGRSPPTSTSSSSLMRPSASASMPEPHRVRWPSRRRWTTGRTSCARPRRARSHSRPALRSITTRAPMSVTALPRQLWKSGATTCTWWSRTSTTGSTPATAPGAWPSSTASVRSPSPRRAAS